MRELVIDNLRNMFSGYLDLVRSLPDSALEQSLTDRSNTIGSQLWCVVGARESTVTGIVREEWPGFTCSLNSDDIKRSEMIETAMKRASEEFEAAVTGVVFDSFRDEMFLGLLEHETQHQGQLIRYLYALDHPFPESWSKRWNL